MIRTLLLTSFLLSIILSDQDKDVKEFLDTYLENRDEILANNRPEPDYEWEIEQIEDFVTVTMNGQVQYGAVLQFILQQNDCNAVYETFQFYTIANHINIKNMEEYVVPISWNGERIYAKIIAVREFGLGHLTLFTMGLFSTDNHIDFLQKYDSYNLEIIDENNFIVTDYFDITTNKWSLKGIKEALRSAKDICAAIK